MPTCLPLLLTLVLATGGVLSAPEASSAQVDAETPVRPGPDSRRSGIGAPLSVAADTVETVAFSQRPLRQILDDVERRTGIQFLYRDALVAGIELSFRTTSTSLLSALEAELASHGLRVQVDASRQQAIITRLRPPASPRILTGVVVDAETGTRLPYATVSWEAEGRRGVAADDEGAFRIPLRSLPAVPFRLRVSYVGYTSQTVTVDPDVPPSRLPVRLRPRATAAPGVLVESRALQSDLHSTWQDLTRTDRTVSLGEESVLEALTPLPSVALTSTLSPGLSVRGSRADGFHVLLDGITIYNQDHLFGLFDAFNEQALQTVGFFYGVAPAEYPAPPGGTLAFQTDPGAHTDLQAHGGMSPVALSATVEGPLSDGRGSWLVAGRHSLLGLDAFGNQSLIEQGLGTERRTEDLPAGTAQLQERVLLPDPASARFFDVHGGGQWETASGHRWRVSTYVGADRARQRGARLRLDRAPTFRERVLRNDFIDTTTVVTRNRWGNQGASLHWQTGVGAAVVSDVTAAASHYYSRYADDDFLYLARTDDGLRFFTDRFSHSNDVLDVSLTHKLSGPGGDALGALLGDGFWTVGSSLRVYDVVYEEASAFRPAFRGAQSSTQVDLFGEYALRLDRLDAHLGLRTHYYSQSGGLRLSPRLDVQLVPDAPISVGAGYSRNYQFMHRLNLVEDVSSAVWVPSTETQPPGVVDHWMASVTARLGARTDLQVEGFWKRHENLRLHETLTRLERGDAVLLFQPWTVRNTSMARGVETLIRHRWATVTWTGAYTLSRVDVDPVGPSRAEPAAWDRRHQLTTRLVWTPVAGAAVFGTWVYGSGTPNPYANRFPDAADRLDTYHRLDVGARYRWEAGSVDMEVDASVLNAYARDNPWYRTVTGVVQPDGSDANARPDLGFTPVDVYDLGFRPALSLAVHF